MTIRFDAFELDDGRRQLFRDGAPVHLHPKGLRLLQFLIERRPNAVSKQEIYDHLWPSTFVSEVNLPSLIADLRSAMGDDAHSPRFIRTVHGFGYAFCGQTEEAVAPQENHVALLIHAGRELRLRNGLTVIGRDRDLACSIDDPTVSRHHAEVNCSAEAASIRDLESKNGTFVGGIQVRDARELYDGDLIRVGSVELVFRRPRQEGTTLTMQRV